jgi:hypothetical protein
LETGKLNGTAEHCGQKKSFPVIMQHISNMRTLVDTGSVPQCPPLSYDLLMEALKKSRGNKQKAVALLGIHRSCYLNFN